MLRIAVLGILLQLVLQTGIAQAICCDDIRSDIENRTLAFNVLCTKNDPHLGNCCHVIEHDLHEHKLAYETLCHDHANKSCADLYESGVREDGVYTINPDDLGAFKVRCDMTTDGGGWTVFQKRQDGSEDFYRGWADYKAGFGDLSGEFWLGLDKIYRLSEAGQNVLRVDLQDFNDVKRYAKYGTFSVADESDKYRLNVASYSGNAGDSLSYHNGMQFSTKDSDNDADGTRACAVSFKGSGWYKNCYISNLNALYLGAGKNDATGMSWRQWKSEVMKKTEIKARPSQFGTH